MHHQIPHKYLKNERPISTEIQNTCSLLIRTSTRVSLSKTINKQHFKRSSTPKTLLKVKKSILTSTQVEQIPLKIRLANISFIDKKAKGHGIKNTRFSHRKLVEDENVIKFSKILNGSFSIGNYKLWIL